MARTARLPRGFELPPLKEGGWEGVALGPAAHGPRRGSVRQLQGFRFRCLVPIDGYIADFICPQARPIIELDGSQHMEQAQYDAARTAGAFVFGLSCPPILE
ncbi:MAG TPA: DUF559 domain-containing protein [Lysobacter sp.]|nr:DUF559 domain-containing protein [Lysobacter sp.]